MNYGKLLLFLRYTCSLSLVLAGKRLTMSAASLSVSGDSPSSSSVPLASEASMPPASPVSMLPVSPVSMPPAFEASTSQ